jgi:hypothetical protein
MSVEYLSAISDKVSVTASYQGGNVMQCSIPGVPISHFLLTFILPLVVCSGFFPPPPPILEGGTVTVFNIIPVIILSLQGLISFARLRYG